MGLRQKRKRDRQTICGRGFCQCHSKQYVHGKGFIDSIKNIAMPAINLIKDNQDTLKSGAEAIGNLVKIGDSTKTIVQEIMKKRQSKDVAVNNLQSIVDKINKFKMGSGFAYI